MLFLRVVGIAGKNSFLSYGVCGQAMIIPLLSPVLFSIFSEIYMHSSQALSFHRVSDS